MNIQLCSLDKTLKLFLIVFLLVQCTGVITGLIYLEYTTKYSTENAVSRFRDSDSSGDFEFQKEYAKPAGEMLITTHNHVLGFSFILFSTGIIFYFSTLIKGFWKIFLLIEPLVSAVVSFGSLWLVRLVHEDFVYLTVISAVLLYLSYFAMTGVSLYELIFLRNTDVKVKTISSQ